MDELVKVIAKALVDSPNEVQVSSCEDGEMITVQLSVAPEDMGKVIGKHGRIAKSIRAVVRAAATKAGKKVKVEIN